MQLLILETANKRQVSLLQYIVTCDLQFNHFSVFKKRSIYKERKRPVNYYFIYSD